MLLEMLVISTCFQKEGCTESTSAYYKYNKDAEALVKNVETVGKRLIKGNEWLVYSITPAYAMVLGQTANFKVYKTLIFKVNTKDQMLAFQFTY